MLQDQLEGTENRVAVARTDYNAAVNELNAFVRRFPYNLTAKIFGMGEPREYFEATLASARICPPVTMPCGILMRSICTSSCRWP